jgi:hypothetical protein
VKQPAHLGRAVEVCALPGLCFLVARPGLPRYRSLQMVAPGCACGCLSLMVSPARSSQALNCVSGSAVCMHLVCRRCRMVHADGGGRPDLPNHAVRPGRLPLGRAALCRAHVQLLPLPAALPGPRPPLHVPGAPCMVGAPDQQLFTSRAGTAPLACTPVPLQRLPPHTAQRTGLIQHSGPAGACMECQCRQ